MLFLAYVNIQESYIALLTAFEKGTTLCNSIQDTKTMEPLRNYANSYKIILNRVYCIIIREFPSFLGQPLLQVVT